MALFTVLCNFDAVAEDFLYFMVCVSFDCMLFGFLSTYLVDRHALLYTNIMACSSCLMFAIHVVFLHHASNTTNSLND